MFGEQVIGPAAVGALLGGAVVALEGHELRLVDAGQGDIGPSTVPHVRASTRSSLSGAHPWHR
jgi:hypothetical protein